ncbi:MAG: hypothetical protein L6Q94_06410, partial [Calditrichia bacterium]|nr:hypothetical protein [Calditrichia bacterium]
ATKPPTKWFLRKKALSFHQAFNTFVMLRTLAPYAKGIPSGVAITLSSAKTEPLPGINIPFGLTPKVFKLARLFRLQIL